jgi:hypothetical protein
MGCASVSGARRLDRGSAWLTEPTRWHCPRGIVLLPVVDMNFRLPFNRKKFRTRSALVGSHGSSDVS